MKKFEAQKNKIVGNHVVSDSNPTPSPEGSVQKIGFDIQSFVPDKNNKYNFNSTTQDDNITPEDAIKFIQPHYKMMTFEKFTQTHCNCCERCNCQSTSTNCLCHCSDCICQEKTHPISESESIDPESESEPWYEPEWCEDCSQQAEENGIEYEPNFTWTGDIWICDHCRHSC